MIAFGKEDELEIKVKISENDEMKKKWMMNHNWKKTEVIEVLDRPLRR